jgi:replicative DNA helicase
MVIICDQDYPEESEYNVVFNKFEHKLHSFQKYSIESIIKGQDTLVCASTGSGKCHAINTPILMFDGSIKMVQDIIIGDQIMGDDSKSRNVLNLGRGRDTMYEIIQTNGESHTFNSEHILCLKNTSCINEISIKNYLKLSKKKKIFLKLYKVPVEFQYKNVPFDPYIIGFLIGKNIQSNKITSQNSVFLHYLANLLPKYGCYLQYMYEYDYMIVDHSGLFLTTFNADHIPDIYKINSREIRLKLLSGLIDANEQYTHREYE